MLNYLERLERIARSTLAAALVPRKRPSSIDRRVLRIEDLDARMMLSATPGDTVVTFNFTIGGQQESVQVELFNNDAPDSVSNFLTYVNSGGYNNTIIHRSSNVASEHIGVIQGGGYTTDGNHIASQTPSSGLPLESSDPNSLNTLAMARGGDPNSGTSEWFFNTSDNSSSLPPGSAGGYTVFGRVLNSDSSSLNAVLAAIKSLQTINANGSNSQGPFGTLPVSDPNADLTPDNLVLLNSITVPEVSGTVFGDVNQNGTQDPGEQVLQNWNVYADLNNNGAFDSDEPSSATDANGVFSFLDVPEGDYVFRAEPKANWAQSAPAISPGNPLSGGISVSIINGQSVTGLRFGEVLTLPAPAAPVFTPVGAGQPVQYDSGVLGDNITNIALPMFNVSGVLPGATVQLFDDQGGGHVLLGSAVASGTTVTISVTNALAAGPHKITAVQTELGFTGSASTQLPITVDLTPPQISPALLSLAPVNVPFTFTAMSDDPAATYGLGAHPAGMTINPSTGIVSWTPTNADVGYKQFVVTATDVAGNTDQGTFSLGVDGPPQFAPMADQLVNQGSTVTIVPVVVDISGPVTYVLGPSLPADATFDPATGTLSWSPTSADAAGGYQFTIQATDAQNRSATQTVKITVIAPPVILPVGDRPVDEQTTLSIPLSATDQGPVTYALLGTVPAGASVAFTGVSAPSGIFVTTSGVFTWTPSEAQGPGVYTFTLQATGAGGLTTTQSFQITVNEVDLPPVLAPVNAVAVAPGSTLSVTFTAQDIDLPAQQLIFSLDPGAPAGASINPQTGVLTWAVPNGIEASTFNMTVRVTEVGGQGLSATVPLTVSVSSGFNGFDLFTTGAVNLGGFANGLALNSGVPINAGLSISPASPGLPGALPAQIAALQQLAGVAPSGPAGFSAAQAALASRLVDYVIGFDAGIPHDAEGMEKELARLGGTGDVGNSPETGMPKDQVEKANFEDGSPSQEDKKQSAPKNGSGQIRFNVPPLGESANRGTSFWGPPQARLGTMQVGAYGGRVYRAPRGLSNVPRLPSEISWQFPTRDDGESAGRNKTAGTAAASAMVMPLLVADLPGNERRKPRTQFGRGIERLGR